MNIFFLSLIIEECARFLNDKHVVKMCLEAAQMLWSAHYFLKDDSLNIFEKAEKENVKIYRNTHKNHPTSLWVRSSNQNYIFAADLGLAICKEYTFRYKKKHACEEVLSFLRANVPSKELFEEKVSETSVYATVNIPVGCTKVPLAITDKSYHVRSDKGFDLIQSYRAYYIGGKGHIAKWSHRPVPSFIQPDFTEFKSELQVLLAKFEKKLIVDPASD